jgi:antirestriction protein ArdC
MPTKTKKVRKTNAEIYQQVTDRVVAALEGGTVPWQKGWMPQGGFFRNGRTNRSYRGVNILLLLVASLEKGYTSPFWVTYKQAGKMGGNVKKDEECTRIVFNSRIVSKEKVENPLTGEMEPKVFWMMREYRVFNIAQTEGIDLAKLPVIEKETKHSACRKAEKILKGMPATPAKVFHRQNSKPSYTPFFDHIEMPNKGQFETREAYYGTLFHETVHSTGHSSRLNVQNIVESEELKGAVFGSEDYSEEELRAELGAAFLTSMCGMDTAKEQDNTAAYLHNWIGRLKAEPKLIYTAAQGAQRACDYITNVKFGE